MFLFVHLCLQFLAPPDRLYAPEHLRDNQENLD